MNSPTTKRDIPKGFRAPPRPPKPKPIPQMNERELWDAWHKACHILRSSAASTSDYINRISAERDAIRDRLIEVVGVDAINNSMQQVSLAQAENGMEVDAPANAQPEMIETKRRVLAQYGPHSAIGGIDFGEAVRLQQEAVQRDRERQRRQEEKKLRLDEMIKKEKDRHAQILAYMFRKPTDSDLDDDSDYDEDEQDIASWFEDDQDDGRKGQDIVEPDEEDYSDIIRVDGSRMHYSTFYEPRDDDD